MGFPTDEHGLNEYRPWQATTLTTPGAVLLTVKDVESQTGVEVGFTLILDADHSYLHINPWLQNNTAQAHTMQYWLNAMIALDNNSTSGQTEFLVPASAVVIHSTGDGQLPGEHGVMSGWCITAVLSTCMKTGMNGLAFSRQTWTLAIPAFMITTGVTACCASSIRRLSLGTSSLAPVRCRPVYGRTTTANMWKCGAVASPQTSGPTPPSPPESGASGQNGGIRSAA
ncbi:MAG: hypothetical protein M5U34_31715 [Chloroflexi bacterium]|nr:hypothetical protein [Chloroflexota bacterium]